MKKTIILALIASCSAIDVHTAKQISPIKQVQTSTDAEANDDFQDMDNYDFLETTVEEKDKELDAKLDAQQKKELKDQDEKCAREKTGIMEGVNLNGVYYKKVNGEWHYYGTTSAGNTNPGWTFTNGYWYYHGFAYTNYKGMWYRYYENAWHKFEKTLPAAPADPAGKYKIEKPNKPDWKAVTKPKVIAPKTGKTSTSSTTKPTVKKAPAPKLTAKENASAQNQITSKYGK